MNPKFSVGEVVILQSLMRPDLNGEYEVILVVDGKCIYECPVTKKPVQRINDGFGYILNDGQVDDHGRCNQWAESSLRKKHQPGEHSFTDLMASLKNPVSV